WRFVVGVAPGQTTERLGRRSVETLRGGVARVQERQQAGRRLQVEARQVVERVGEGERPERAARDRHRNRPAEDSDGQLVELPGDVSVGRGTFEPELGGRIFGKEPAVTGAA